VSKPSDTEAISDDCLAMSLDKSLTSVYKGTVMEVVIAEAREISKKKASAAAN
jgi:hypothetical protein